MKKIGILTFHKSINYGSVLQAYALQKTINKLGYETEIIDYTPNNYGYMYSLFRKIKCIDDIKYNLGNLQYYALLKRRKRCFEEFRKKYLILSEEEYRCGDSLERLNCLYNGIVCGSDQIWNPKAKDADVNFYLPFPFDGRKISYAVSINDGIIEDDENGRQLISWISDFSYLSVREENARENLIGYLEKEVAVVLDPTLLNECDFFDEICSERIIKEKYVFLYSIGYSDDVAEAARYVSELTGEKVYILYTSRGTKRIIRQNKDFICLNKEISPEDFISLIKYADFVITDSFHGTAFSINYKKKFYSIAKLKNGEKVFDTRIYGILSKLGLAKRFVTCDELRDSNLSEAVNYSEVSIRKKKLMDKSMMYLTEALEDLGV